MDNNLERLRSIKSFPSLVKYLRDELHWPIESEDVEDLTFEYDAEELGFDPKTAAKIREIKQLRPFVTGQPWGIFYINFEPKQLPVVALRRILSKLVLKKRASGNKAQQATWLLNDLLFISSYGESDQRAISFAHFSEDKQFGDLPTLRVLGWDSQDTVLRLEDVEQTLSNKLRWPEDENNVDDWRKTWSSAFTLGHREVVKTSKELAVKLADLAIVIRQRANKVLSIESENGPMRKLYKAFQEALIHDLDEDGFADMYAQTIAYGLLTARVSRPSGLVVENVADMVPITNPFLKELLQTFLTVGGRKGKIDFDELGINEIVELLRIANMEAVLKDFGDRNPLEDPVIHFYELFLKEYDPEKRMKRGVFYTPRPVVSFIVRSVDEILRTEFGLEDGLADTTTWGEMANRSVLPTVADGSDAPTRVKIPDGVSPDEPFVQILDPAAGTGTFLVEVIDQIYQTLCAKWTTEKRNAREMDELWNDYVPQHLLPRLHGFELMMAPYAIAHMKIGLKLRETHYSFLSSERARIYLSNTLEEPEDFSSYFEQMAPALAHEANAANTVKRRTPVTVVIGNPPYSHMSANLSESARRIVDPYRYVDGERIQERGAIMFERTIQDDYVKFFAKACSLLTNQVGVLAYISNSAYTHNPTLRGMRFDLSRRFSHLFILDLHGDQKSLSRGDENVFDIRTGVAISILAKTSTSSRNIVKWSELMYSRPEKYRFLLDNTLSSVKSAGVTPGAPFFLFIPVDNEDQKEFNNGWSVDEVFNLKSEGIKTNRDHFVVDFNDAPILERLRSFMDQQISVDTIKERLELNDNVAWKVKDAREACRTSFSEQYFTNVAYRPFDQRRLYYHPCLVFSPRPVLMKHVLNHRNLVLLTVRRIRTQTHAHFFVTHLVAMKEMLSSADNCNVYPLYEYPSTKAKLDFGVKAVPNLKVTFQNTFSSLLDLASVSLGRGDLDHTVGPEDYLHYIYSIFHSPSYRARYAEFLKMDFPRIPLTCDITLFRKLCAIGADLVALHLLEDDYEAASWNKGGSMKDETKNPFARLITSYKGNDSAEVTKGHPKYKDGAVYINTSHYFEGIPEEVWSFHVGSYQVCEKWLKDRRGRTLSDEDVKHYQRVVVALNETIRLMAEIDRVIEEHGGWPLVGSQDAALSAGITARNERESSNDPESSDDKPAGEISALPDRLPFK